MKKLKVLCACEESQAVCLAFRQRGHLAYSCDLKPCSGGFSEYHIQGDVTKIINADWDIIIAFPPCTYLTKAGACNTFNADHSIKDFKRYQAGLAAVEFFNLFYYNKCPHIAIENPTPMKIFQLPKPNCVIQPYEFGHFTSKRTCLWLKGLPPLMPTSYILKSDITIASKSSWFTNGTGQYRSTNRSKTFNGVAQAMAEQWGDYICGLS